MDGYIWWNICGNESSYDAFWNPNLTLYSSNPDLSSCFQSTVFYWVPAVWIILTSISFILSKTIHRSVLQGWKYKAWLNRVKLILCGLTCVNILLCLVKAVYNVVEFNSPLVTVLAYTIQLLTMMLMVFVIHDQYRRGVHSSGTQFLFWAMHVILGIVTIRSTVLRFNRDIPQDLFLVVNYYIFFALVCIQWIASMFIEHKPAAFYMENGDETTPLLKKDMPITLAENSEESPEQWATFVSSITYFWFTKLLLKGWKRILQFEDVYDLDEINKTKPIMAKFYKCWHPSPRDFIRDNNLNTNGPSLFKAMMQTSGHAFYMSAICRGACLFVIFTGPLLMRMMLEYIDSGDDYSWKGFSLAVCLCLSSELHTLGIQSFLYYSYNFGLHLRTIVNAAVYKKSLRLSKAAKRHTTVGEIVNLMSVDAQKLQDVPPYVLALITTPITAVVCTILLWQTVGIASLAGVLLLLLTVPFNGIYVGNKIRLLQNQQMNDKDVRVRTMNEVLSGIKVLKLYAWEKIFQNRVTEQRAQELHSIKRVNIVNSISAVAWNTSTYLVCLAIFATYVLISEENVLNAEKIFFTISVVNLLNFPLALLSIGIGFVGQSIVSMKRIRNFLLLEEIQDDGVSTDPYMEDAVQIKNGTFSWGQNISPVLTDINLSVKKGELVAVVGQVGCGKSSLVSALLGETWKITGTVTLSGTTAYVPQEAWIQNKTLKGNILFNKPDIAQKYKEVLEKCSLKPDLKILSHGDMTEIGEKGINLSGGQKQRVSLARAVYQEEDIYLLDDPLSAVDTHVGKELFENVIGPNGMLKDKTRVLVTHSVTFLPQVDRIVVMKDGKISESGSYQELLKERSHFAEFLLTHVQEQDHSSENSSDGEIHQLKRKLSSLFEQDIHDRSVSEDGETMPLKDGKGLSKVAIMSLLTRRKSSSGSGLRRRRLSSTRSDQDRQIEKKLSAMKGQNLIKEEQEKEGNVSLDVIVSYIKAAGPFWFSVGLLFYLVFLVAMVMGNIWLSSWSNDPPAIVNLTEVQPNNTEFRLGIYGGFIAVQVLTIQIGSMAIAFASYYASKLLHFNLLKQIIRAPMRFFDTTPLGRIMNRCSKDLDYVDVSIPFMIRNWLYVTIPLFGTFFIICYSTPIFLAVALPISIVYVLLQRLYIKSARQLRRIDSVKRSPVFIHFDESIGGASSIRAYNRTEEFIERCNDLIDDSQKAWYMVLISMRWLGVTMETLGALVTLFASIFVVLQKDTIGSGLAGVSISYALQVSVFMNMFVRGSSELETYLVAVERIKEYSEIESEADLEIPDNKPSREWPNIGQVTFEKFSTKYRPTLKNVLNNISCCIEPSEKVGIVGRTGAGKSSIALSLFRIIEATEGKITIDGVDISQIGLHDLRSKLTVIPQDPVIFCGSLRSNLDPEEKFADPEIWKSLELAHLREFVSGLPLQLEYECGEGGEALSVGQRQLVCLSRALLRKTQVLVLDEATSGVDLETDELIQATIRTAFSGCTVITIAHRLNTILDYDRVMVMDNGKILEFDQPDSLLQNENSVFHSMAKNAKLC